MNVTTRGDGATVGTVSKSKKKTKKVVSRVEIEPTENSGAVLKCYYRNDGPESNISYFEPSTNAYASVGEALDAAGEMLDAGEPDDNKDEG